MNAMYGTRSANTTKDISTLWDDWDISQKYAQHRHRYSPQLFHVISDYCRQAGNNLDLAVDIAPGPGNSTVGFASHFRRVMGIDSSHTQVKFAPDDVPNCEFKVGKAHDLPFIECETVDLVGSGMAFHLLPQKEAFAEVNRILKPGGTLAIFGHGPPTCSDKRMEAFIQAAVGHLKSRVPDTYLPILTDYKNVQHPYLWATRIPGVVVNVRHSMSLNGVLSVYEFMQRVLSQFAQPKDTHGVFLREVKSRVNDFFPDFGEEAYQDPCFDFHFEIAVMAGTKPGP